MDEYKKLIDSYKDIKQIATNSAELCKMYGEFKTPAFELYQPVKMSSTQTSPGTPSSQSSDTSDFTASSGAARLLESQSRNLSSSSSSHILTQEQRKSFKGLILIAKDMIHNGRLTKGNLANNVAKIPNLPLEVLWWYHCSDIMHITIFIALNLSESGELERLISGLNELMSTEQGEGVKTGIVADFLSSFVAMVYGPEPPASLHDTRKACSIILNSIFRKQSEAIKEAKGGIWWIPQLIGEQRSLPAPVVQICTSKLLILQLTEPPYISTQQALSRQTEWNYRDSPPILTGFFQHVLNAIGSPQDVLSKLNAILLGDDVNWKSVLICFSTFLHCQKGAASFMSEFISDKVKHALNTESQELMLLSFLLARQCATEGSNVGCLSYPAWYKKSFGIRSSTLAPSQSNCKFLLQFLTQLVPYEPGSCLKAHLDQVQWVPASCRPELQDYLALANTRLKDLGGGPADSVVGLFQSGGDLSPNEQVTYDIDRAIEHFEKTGKIHASILEGSVFKRKYFETIFLPKLLKPRAKLTSNDAQMLLIDKLLKVGKISNTQYNTYHSLCLTKN